MKQKLQWETIKMKTNDHKQNFLLTFFNNEIKYEEKEVNNYWLIKSINGKTEQAYVAIYTQESFKRYKKYKKSD